MSLLLNINVLVEPTDTPRSIGIQVLNVANMLQTTVGVMFVPGYVGVTVSPAEAIPVVRARIRAALLPILPTLLDPP